MQIHGPPRMENVVPCFSSCLHLTRISEPSLGLKSTESLKLKKPYKVGKSNCSHTDPCAQMSHPQTLGHIINWPRAYEIPSSHKNGSKILSFSSNSEGPKPEFPKAPQNQRKSNIKPLCEGQYLFLASLQESPQDLPQVTEH